MVSKNIDSALSPLQAVRNQYQPRVPPLLTQLERLALERETPPKSMLSEEIKALFPQTSNQPLVRLKAGPEVPKPLPRRVGVVFSGGQAPGGHNVLAGLYDALKQRNPASRLFGFRDGPSGLLGNLDYVEIHDQTLTAFRNTGGFDLLGSGRTKIETPEQLEGVKKMAWALELHAIVIVGGDDSNTVAATLAEYFLQDKVPCQVLGVPKTIDGDLRNQYIEMSFGFDTACKNYSDTIGNIARDALSAKKSYYFIKMMGRSASHVTLECALQTHPNLAFISEEIDARKLTLTQVTREIADLVCSRAKKGKHYGVVLIPEGIIEFLSDCRVLFRALNTLSDKETLQAKLEPEALACYRAFPKQFQDQLFLDRDPHGNIQVSKIDTERLFIALVKRELDDRKAKKKYAGGFSAQPHFCGYEGRSCFPSNFDSDYCYALGLTAAALIEQGVTGYVVFIQGLKESVGAWRPGGCPLASMMHIEERKGQQRPVIAKALVDLQGPLFQEFAKRRSAWATDDAYRYPGPIQYFGPPDICDALTYTLRGIF
jgi:pyrophosphate--fructose-6-phosphate 1-phosphotransferase